MAAYFAALDPMTLVRALPGNVAQGIIWGIMALGVYITFRILDFADLTVDGSLATGGAVAVMLIRAGVNPALALVFAFLAGMAAGFVTGVLHTFFGIPGILASILTPVSYTHLSRSHPSDAVFRFLPDYPALQRHPPYTDAD